MKRFTFLAVACLLALTTMASWDGTTTSTLTIGSGTENEAYINENGFKYVGETAGVPMKFKPVKL